MNWIGNLVCKLFHRDSIMHPSHGIYRCRKCLRTFPVQWEGSLKPQAIRPNGRIFQQGEQMEKKTQEVRLYERRHAKRAEKSQMFRIGRML